MGHALTSEQAAARTLFYQLDEHDHEAGGSTLLGFWIYLMSDCLIFAVLFATYGVLGRNYAAGPGAEGSVRPVAGRAQHDHAAVVLDDVRLRHAVLVPKQGRRPRRCGCVVTGLFERAFLSIELYEFSHMIHEGATPAAQRVPVLRSSRWWLRTVLHVTFGIVWLITLMVQIGGMG